MATAPKLEYGHITHDPEVRAGKACIDGTRIAVVDIVVLHKGGYRPEEMLEHYMRPLTLAQVHSALAYYYDHREEVEAYFDESQQVVAELEVGARRVPAPSSGRVVPGRFSPFTDENIDGPIIRGLRQRGRDVQGGESGPFLRVDR